MSIYEIFIGTDYLRALCKLGSGRKTFPPVSGCVQTFWSLLTYQISLWFFILVFDGIPTHFVLC